MLRTIILILVVVNWNEDYGLKSKISTNYNLMFILDY